MFSINARVLSSSAESDRKQKQTAASAFITLCATNTHLRACLYLNLQRVRIFMANLFLLQNSYMYNTFSV